MAHIVDKAKLIENVDHMINLLEFDGMRSSGKMKLNSGHLESLYNLKDRYEAEAKKKPAAKKEG